MAPDALKLPVSGMIGEDQEARATRLFDRALELALEAQQRAGGAVERRFRVGGRQLHLQFAGSVLEEPLCRAFAHLETGESSGADFTVHLWDSTSSGLHMPAPPWPKDEYRQCGEIRGFIGNRIYTHFDGAQQALTVIDFHLRTAVYWMRSSTYIPYYERAAPLRAFLHAWMSRYNLHHVHGAAVGRPDGGVLLAGGKGAGKSNTALSCLDSDLQYVGDDHCLVGLDPDPTVYSIYSSGKTYREDVRRLPFLGAMVSNPDGGHEDKALYFFHEHLPLRMTSGFPLRAVLLPRVSGRTDTAFSSAATANGLKTLVPDAMLKWPSLGQQTFTTLTGVFRVTPCFYLDVGTDVSQIPRTIEQILDLVCASNPD